MKSQKHITNMKSQKHMFYESHLTIASKNHLAMAELQAKAGRHDLAFDSRKTAMARRIASRNIAQGLVYALRFGEEESLRME